MARKAPSSASQAKGEMMKSSAICVLATLCLFLIASTALANESFTMTADSTMDGNDGVLMRITATGESGSTMFLFEESGMVRAYAERDDATGTWEFAVGAQYICPTTSMTINDTWRALDEDGDETIATVVAQEMVTVTAGTFSCFKVEVAKVSASSTVIQELWFSSGVGIIRQTDTFPVPWQSDLFNFGLVGGSGFFPLSAGNIWNYQEITSPVESSTWGGVKALYE